ncbi:MAG: peroxidase-related enzyme, partial [Beijerinckiaceae bacterium]
MSSAKSKLSKSRSEKARTAQGAVPHKKSEPGEKPRRQDATAHATALELAQTDLSEAMQAYFAKCDEKIGFVPNVLKAYAFDNAKLEAFVGLYNDLMLAPSGLSKLEREMIAVAVSSANRCYYCLVAHGAAVRALSGDPALGELMVMNYRAARLSKRQRAM